MSGVRQGHLSQVFGACKGKLFILFFPTLFMKKRAVLGVLVVSILLISVVYSVNLASAGLLGDAWNKITGKVVDNASGGDEEEVAPEPECSSLAISMWCPDEKTLCPTKTDEKGCSVWDCDSCETAPEPEPPEQCIKKGEKGGLGAECCEGLKEVSDCLPDQPCPISLRYCIDCGNGKCESHENWYNCEEDCEQEEPPEKRCEDGEIEYYECLDGTKVHSCLCENGKWGCVITPENACPEPPEPETCASRIQIISNKDVYKVGDDVKIIIEVFGSQGEHLPDYPFSAQMYDDRWHTADSQKTDNKGYFIFTTTAQKPAGGVTEVKFKVYTKETSSCGSVEDIKEIKIKLEECGMGECAPEPECKDKVRKCGGVCPPCPEDEDGDIFYVCSGCELEGKCYPYGHRKGGNYCSDENDMFIEQREADRACENNFECKTNLCIDGSCISSSLWNKFLVWFRKIAGGEEEDKEFGDCSKLLIEKDIKDWEYLESIYGSTKESQVPVYSKDGTYLDTLKCCLAGYERKETNEQKAALVCEYDNREELKNSLYWVLITKEGLYLEFELTEYKGEKVYGSIDEVGVVWTSDNYLVGSGGPPSVGTPFSEDITDAYLEKYPNDFDLTEGDIPYTPPNPLPDEKGKSFVFCTEEDKIKAKECGYSRGAPQSDPSTLERTEQSKIACIESGGHAEGCCEVYTGCIMPDETCEDITIVSKDECYWHVARLNNDASLCEKINDGFYKGMCLKDTIAAIKNSNACEKIEDKEYRNKCYLNIAEQTSDSNICEKIDDDSLKEKCYFWVAEQKGSIGTCEGITDSNLQAMCYVEVARKTEDVSYCDKITDSHIGDKCYRDVGIQTNNPILCEKIIEEQAKQKCLDNTS